MGEQFKPLNLYQQFFNFISWHIIYTIKRISLYVCLSACIDSSATTVHTNIKLETIDHHPGVSVISGLVTYHDAKLNNFFKFAFHDKPKMFVSLNETSYQFVNLQKFYSLSSKMTSKMFDCTTCSQLLLIVKQNKNKNCTNFTKSVCAKTDS